jgi:excinuclease UvrABC nuclease subunit
MNWRTERDIDQIKRSSGVYAMYTGRKDLKYIGYSNNIFDRLLKHELSWSYVKVRYLSVDKAKQLEYRLIKKLKPNFNQRHKNKALSAKHRIRLYPETYHTLKVASDYNKKSVANIIKELIEKSDDLFIKKARKISKIMIKEFYED